MSLPTLQQTPQVNCFRVSVRVRNLGNRDITIPAKVDLCSVEPVQEIKWERKKGSTTKAVPVVNTPIITHEDELELTVEQQQFIDQFGLEGISIVAKNRLIPLLLKWERIFSKGDHDLGRTSLIKHRIPLNDDTPIVQRYRRVPPSMYIVSGSLAALENYA